MMPLMNRDAWQKLQSHYTKVRELSLRELFADDPERAERMTIEAVGHLTLTTRRTSSPMRRSRSS
jgi:hypothetical protein